MKLKLRWSVQALLVFVIMLLLVAVSCQAVPPTPTPTPTPTPSPTPSPTPTPTPTPTPSPTGVMELKFAHQHREGSSDDLACVALARLLQEETKGRLRVKIFPAEGLGKVKDHLDMLRKGVCDIALCPTFAYPGQLPMVIGFELPMSGIPCEPVATSALWELYHKGHFSELNEFKVLGLRGTAPLVIAMKNKPVTKPGDLKGLKIRGLGPQMNALLAACGATVVSIAAPDLYMSAERGVIDGLVTAIDTIAGFKLYEVVKYKVHSPIAFGVLLFLMSKEKWDRLPADVQIGVERAVHKFRYVAEEIYFRERGRSWKVITDYGMQKCYLSPEAVARMKELAAPISEAWIKETEAKGLPARQMIQDLASIVSRYAEY